jgi:hypothetical protein
VVDVVGVVDGDESVVEEWAAPVVVVTPDVGGAACLAGEQAARAPRQRSEVDSTTRRPRCRGRPSVKS